MLFNSLNFAIFFPIVYILYWYVFKKNLVKQNILLLVASYFFYGSWDYRFLFLLIFSTFLDYFCGLKISASDNRSNRRFWLWFSIALNLGFLGLFKYYNFFVTSFADGLTALGLEPNVPLLEVILPVGISFYTFHGLSYIIDIYNRRITAETNFVDYGVFVSFFPLLVAGPIERATHLLPQIKSQRTFDYHKSVDGLRQILWGLFKKIVIADNCAVYVNNAYADVSDSSGSTLVIASVLFAIQIYCDFSGYSDIALGTARLLGIELLRNFAFPYFSRDIAEFWRRWHISLTTWFRDYVYIPLGGSRVGKAVQVRNTFIIFLLSGFWHGASWNFIAWGLLNALYFLPLLLLGSNRNYLSTVAEGRMIPNLKDLFSIVTTFTLTVGAWIFFRSQSLSDAFSIYAKIMSQSVLSRPIVPDPVLVVLIVFFFVVEWVGRENKYGLEKIFINRSAAVRWGLYYVIAMLAFLFAGNEQQFIYFQF